MILLLECTTEPREPSGFPVSRGSPLWLGGVARSNRSRRIGGSRVAAAVLGLLVNVAEDWETAERGPGTVNDHRRDPERDTPMRSRASPTPRRNRGV